MIKTKTESMGYDIYIDGDQEAADLFDEQIKSLVEEAYGKPDWYYKELVRHKLGLVG